MLRFFGTQKKLGMTKAVAPFVGYADIFPERGQRENRLHGIRVEILRHASVFCVPKNLNR